MARTETRARKKHQHAERDTNLLGAKIHEKPMIEIAEAFSHFDLNPWKKVHDPK
jgi:hypothetical protein